jgi:hypothetical protein
MDPTGPILDRERIASPLFNLPTDQYWVAAGLLECMRQNVRSWCPISILSDGAWHSFYSAHGFIFEFAYGLIGERETLKIWKMGRCNPTHPDKIYIGQTVFLMKDGSDFFPMPQQPAAHLFEDQFPRAEDRNSSAHLGSLLGVLTIRRFVTLNYDHELERAFMAAVGGVSPLIAPIPGTANLSPANGARAAGEPVLSIGSRLIAMHWPDLATCDFEWLMSDPPLDLPIFVQTWPKAGVGIDTAYLENRHCLPAPGTSKSEPAITLTQALRDAFASIEVANAIGKAGQLTAASTSTVARAPLAARDEAGSKGSGERCNPLILMGIDSSDCIPARSAFSALTDQSFGLSRSSSDVDDISRELADLIDWLIAGATVIEASDAKQTKGNHCDTRIMMATNWQRIARPDVEDAPFDWKEFLELLRDIGSIYRTLVFDASKTKHSYGNNHDARIMMATNWQRIAISNVGTTPFDWNEFLDLLRNIKASDPAFRRLFYHAISDRIYRVRNNRNWGEGFKRGQATSSFIVKNRTRLPSWMIVAARQGASSATPPGLFAK